MPVLLFILTFFFQLFGGACGCEDKPQVNTLAVVNGIKITKPELGTEAQNKTSLLQNEVIKAREAELDLQINQMLLEAEAKRRGLSPAQLVQLEVVERVVIPTDAEAEEFYKQRKERMPDDFKKVKPQIIALIKSERERIEAMKFAAMLRGTAVISVTTSTATPPANEQELNRVFARVNNRTITSRDIEESLKPLIYSVQEQVYAARKLDLDMRINDLLLEQEAKRQNKTPEALLSSVIRTRLPIITDQQAKAYYDSNKANLDGGFDKLKLQIVGYLTQLEEQKLTTAYATQLRQNAAVQIYLTPPEPPTFKIAVDDQPTRGNPNAKVIVVQFTDFECAVCARQQSVLDRLVNEFETQVKFVVRDYPLPQNQHAQKAAEAAEAARDQGKYWEYVAVLYAHQSALKVENLKLYASQLGLDRAKFDAALDSGRYNAQVQRDVSDGNKIGVSGAPAFFVNGRRLVDLTYEGLKAAIEKALRSN
jgi:protein-disulfide isomerase